MSETNDINEESYKELYLGVPKNKQNDPRWKAVLGMSRKIGILSGMLEMAKTDHHNPKLVKNIIYYCNKEIPFLGEKKKELKREILGIKK